MEETTRHDRAVKSTCTTREQDPYKLKGEKDADFCLLRSPTL